MSLHPRPQGTPIGRAPAARGQVNGGASEDAWLEALVGGVLGLAWSVSVTIVQVVWRYPGTVFGGLVVLAVYRSYGSTVLLVVVVVIVVVVLVVRLGYPEFWSVRVAGPRFRYCKRRSVRRQWRGTCEAVGLSTVRVSHRTGARTFWTPGLSQLRWSSRTGMVLAARVRVLAGQTVDDLAGCAETLASAFGARSVRVRATGPNTADVSWLFTDSLAGVLAPLPVEAVPNLVALPVGVQEDGTPWRLRLAGTHLLIVGVTGAGKGGVIWSLLRALGPTIRSGLVQVWAVDGKGGMELAPGRPLFTHLATTAETGVELLEEAATVLAARAARLAGTTRKHEPTVAEPLLVVLVDELALLTAYVPDRKLRDRAEKALAMIATQGRAPGVVLVAALQDPRKEVVGLRNLFPTKIALRLDEKAQVDMVLGDGARDAGALCHQIPETSPGVTYVKVDGQREPVRVRSAYLDDDHIAALAIEYAAPSDPTTSDTGSGTNDAPATLHLVEDEVSPQTGPVAA
ncbi:hypothetical protein GCM10028783_17910 [Modestobacter muralis]